ncbi:hypothetical protein HMPREF0972_00930 [Actinomyces sp. oral taxon 848 str. F0332]|nr:hypothetical protein HMPREF0972_00930 [Actinomyces sp. oral taxon 848 str. F0332]
MADAPPSRVLGSHSKQREKSPSRRGKPARIELEETPGVT